MCIGVAAIVYCKTKKLNGLRNEEAILTGECPICGSKLEKFYHDMNETIYVCTHCEFAAHQKNEK